MADRHGCLYYFQSFSSLFNAFRCFSLLFFAFHFVVFLFFLLFFVWHRIWTHRDDVAFFWLDHEPGRRPQASGLAKKRLNRRDGSKSDTKHNNTFDNRFISLLLWIPIPSCFFLTLDLRVVTPGKWPFIPLTYTFESREKMKGITYDWSPSRLRFQDTYGRWTFSGQTRFFSGRML